MASNTDLVQQLWSLCNILRDEGITYHQYVNELTYLLFLKMAEETGAEEDLPTGLRWRDLARLHGPEQFDFYIRQLATLGTQPNNVHLRAIFANPTSLLRKSESLNRIVRRMDELDWYSAKQEGFGDLYEGLLQRNASEKKSGAGQYFTARPLIDSMVAVMKPCSDDVIQDPAAGTGGFIVAADRYIQENEDTADWDDERRSKYQDRTFFGMEHVQDTHRLALMNLMLHGIAWQPDGAGIRFGDTLGPEGQALPRATVILTNPPFGTKSGGGLPTRTDLHFPTSNKQFAFLQHIYLNLAIHGRAAVVLPDNVLFESALGRQIRIELMDLCNLHTILRLPTGIFYAQGVKTNVLFFTRGERDRGNTDEVWVYDLRTRMPQFGRRASLTREHFTEFELSFGDDPLGGRNALSKRVDTGENGRFRRFSRAWIAEQGDSLDLCWLANDRLEGGDDAVDPGLLARAAIDELEMALADLHTILSELGEEVES